MTAQIIDGKAVAAAVRERLAAEVLHLKARGIVPGLAVVIVGDNPASQVYVRNKVAACESLGMYSEKHALPGETTESELLALLDRLNHDPKIHGILVQLPLPGQIDEAKVIAAISPKKDVDGFHRESVGSMVIGDARFLPCTPSGVMEMLKYAGIDPRGKHAVVVGRSNIVGKPMAMLLLQADATVTIVHSRTPHLADYTRQADILIAAVGRPRFIQADHVKPGACVIDVGINRLPSDQGGKLCGDVDFDHVKGVAGWISPVPGGVGPMTITMLLANTLRAAAGR